MINFFVNINNLRNPDKWWIWPRPKRAKVAWDKVAEVFVDKFGQYGPIFSIFCQKSNEEIGYYYTNAFSTVPVLYARVVSFL